MLNPVRAKNPVLFVGREFVKYSSFPFLQIRKKMTCNYANLSPIGFAISALTFRRLRVDLKQTTFIMALGLSAFIFPIASEQNYQENDGIENQYCTMEKSHSRKKRLKIFRSIGKGAKNQMRSYEVLLTEKQDKTLSKLLLFLANENLHSIWNKRKSLKKDGDSLRSVHPLRFLAKCYSEDQFVAAMCSIMGKAWVWSNFKTGLYDALDDEFKRNNLLQFVQEFAHNVHVDYALLIQPIENKDWDGLMKTLNDHAPRTGNPNRYDY